MPSRSGLLIIQCPCRHIDSARYYQNEAEVGKAVRESGIPRDEIFVTTKVWLSDFGYKNAKKVCQQLLRPCRAFGMLVHPASHPCALP